MSREYNSYIVYNVVKEKGQRLFVGRVVKGLTWIVEATNRYSQVVNLLTSGGNQIVSRLSSCYPCIHYNDTSCRVSRGFVHFVAHVMDTQWVVRKDAPMFPIVIFPLSVYPYRTNYAPGIFGVSEVVAR